MEPLFDLPVTQISSQQDKISLYKSLQQPISELAGSLKKDIYAKGDAEKNITQLTNLVLFYGSKNSGKTTAVSMLAAQVDKELYKVDLSSLVSKYIGETEKNLSRLFEKAKENNWILFFDEADALFGKRTNVKDSHDRYANMEVSYLIKRMEDYNGLIILASSKKSNIDPAFVRRIRHVVKFPLPTT